MLEELKRLTPVRVARGVHARYGKDGGGQLAAALTYFGFLSIFPLILLALAAVGFVLASNPSAQTQWATRLSESVPGLGPLIGENIDALVAQRAGAGLLGLLGSLWSGTALTNSAGFALSRVFRRPEIHGFVRQKVWSISSTVGLGIVALAGVALSGAVAGISAPGGFGALMGIAATLVAFALDATLFCASYRVLTTGGGPAVRQLLPGALLAGAGWTALKVAGAWYAARTVAGASEVYGTFGSVVGVLTLLYLASSLFLYGAELNALLMERTDGQTGTRSAMRRVAAMAAQRSA